MARRKATRPTDAELEILNILWEHGPATVREVHEALHHDRSTGYTTTLKLMQIMAEKRLLKRDESNRAHVYQSRLPREKTLLGLTRDLLERAFGGSAERLVMHALQAKKVSAGELKRVREMVDEIGRGKR